jgi:hypothetical protein
MPHNFKTPLLHKNKQQLNKHNDKKQACNPTTPMEDLHNK